MDATTEHPGQMAPPDKPRRRWPAVVAYVLLGLVLVAVVAPRPAHMRTPETAGYQLGRSLGLLLLSILISYGIWSLIRRARRSSVKWSPWLVLIACFVATFFKGVVPDRDGSSALTRGGSPAVEVETLSPEEVFVEIEGLRYEPMPPDALEQVETAYLANESAAEAITDIDGRLVFEGRRQIGILTAVFSTEEAAASDEFEAGFVDGFADSVEEQGDGPVTPHELDNGSAHGGPVEQGYALAFTRDNAAIFVLGGDRATAELIANGLLESTD